MALLELRNIRKYYASQKAVDDISCAIEPGSIFGLLGPNGAGKTTLLRMITGIIYPDAGEILFDGKTFDPMRDVGLIGYMPEERGLYKKMKTGEHALYLAQLKGLSHAQAVERVRYWFSRLEMQSWWNKKVSDLSKGMSQKLQFVTTVLHEPKLIILDEPFSGLDPVNANVIKDEIFGLAKNGATVIFSTHRMEQVEEICDHIILVNRGQKILDGSVNAVRQQFKEHLFHIELDRLPAAVSSNAFEIVAQRDNALTVRTAEGHSSNDILQHFLQQQVTILSFREILPTLNEIFIRLVEQTPAARQFETSAS
jgi:ABC-2 type transport system ATP-binding protein